MRAKTVQLAAGVASIRRCARSVGVSHAAIMPLSLNGPPLGFGPYTGRFDPSTSARPVVYIFLDEVDSMRERAADGGAKILIAPTDHDDG